MRFHAAAAGAFGVGLRPCEWHTTPEHNRKLARAGKPALVQAFQALLGHLLGRVQQLVHGLVPPGAPAHAEQHPAGGLLAARQRDEALVCGIDTPPGSQKTN